MHVRDRRMRPASALINLTSTGVPSENVHSQSELSRGPRGEFKEGFRVPPLQGPQFLTIRKIRVLTVQEQALTR